MLGPRDKAARPRTSICALVRFAFRACDLAAVPGAAERQRAIPVSVPPSLTKSLPSLFTYINRESSGISRERWATHTNTEGQCAPRPARRACTPHRWTCLLCDSSRVSGTQRCASRYSPTIPTCLTGSSVCMYVCRKVKNSQARTGHQRGMGGRWTDDDDTHERHTDTNKLTMTPPHEHTSEGGRDDRGVPYHAEPTLSSAQVLKLTRHTARAVAVAASA